MSYRTASTRYPARRAPDKLGRPCRRAEHQLDLIRAEAARRRAGIHIVIDLIHVLEYIWKAAWSLHDAGDPAVEDWVAARALAVLAGDSARTSQEVTAEASAASLPASRRTGADSSVIRPTPLRTSRRPSLPRQSEPICVALLA
jgi:hypothetical protein